MRQVNLDELRAIARSSYEDLTYCARGAGRSIKLYLHWTAGWYSSKFGDYHINIDGDGNIFVSTDDLSEVLAHTWRRNTGAVGIALDCCVGATTNDLGENPPTEAQLKALYEVIAVLAEEFNLYETGYDENGNPYLYVGKNTVLTHGEAADNEDGEYCHEPYGPKSTVERWDLEFLGNEESPEYNPDDEEHRGGTIIRNHATALLN